MNRQERRRSERTLKKQGKEEKKYKIPVLLIQPWSVPVMRTTLPPHVLQTMIEISDLVIADKESIHFGKNLAGQIDTELLVEHNILEQTRVMDYFLNVVRQFVIICKCQSFPNSIKEVHQEEWLSQMSSMWIISQQPGEYNPMHVHTQCQISSVMYLKVPKMLPSKKEHRLSEDGSILFVSNSSRDIELNIPSITFPPQVGDFYIFGAQQQHAVYPYRCEEGDPERRSISFNATFQLKTGYDEVPHDIDNENKNE